MKCSAHRLYFFALAVAAPAACAAPAFAQAVAVQKAIENVVEEISSLEDADATLEVMYEQLAGYAANPLNLNTASEAELMQLHVLNEFQAASIREYIAQYGDMQTPYELQYVHGVTQEMMVKLLPFVAAHPKAERQRPTLRQALTSGQHRLTARARQTVEEQQGYKDGSYMGSPQALYARYRYTFSDKLQWGVTADKDAGEPFGRRGNEAGFDFYSGHIQANNVGILRTLVLGDFYAQFGQGLALWKGGAMGKSSDALSIAKRGSGIKAYGGTNENLFFRGAAASVNISKAATVTAFFSYKNVDANADTLGIFSTLQTTGLHATPKAMAEKDAVTEMAAGANVSYSMKKLRVGLTGLWHKLGGDYQKNVHPYSHYELSKNENANLSAEYRGYFRKLHLFGELGVSQNGGVAVLNGCLASVAPRMQLALLHRYYQPQYQAYYSGAFAEGGKTANENGFYIGANIFPHPKVKTSLYFDAYAFPWLRYRAMSPSKGFDFMLQADYAPQQHCKMSFRLRYDSKEENVTDELSPTKTVDAVEKIGLRYGISYQLLAGLDCETRVEAASYRAGQRAREQGVMAFQDAQYSLQLLPLSLSLRYAIFSTDSYAARIYAYERDVLYAFSVPACYGQGARWFVNLQWQPTDRVSVWLRCAQTSYFDRTSTGSNLTLIDSSHHTDVKLQLVVKL
ncbi:MAG: helix-hairpin-helix domain-containing protein [Prevotellaceae bacterium]|jgi:DNA uptake protein ComE-like DNA-binding protein|nr:helix-hairpin-helix domain-containing protein [Prevotellaceae bacterium]